VKKRASASGFAPHIKLPKEPTRRPPGEMLYNQTNPSQTGVYRIAEFTSEDNSEESVRSDVGVISG
jgi:hypothetical protein